MHCLNLCIGYGVGLKENVIYRVVTDPVTKAKMKKRVFVTEGAVQRGHKLTEVQQLHGLPEISGPIDIDRISGIFELSPTQKKDMEVFICISTAEWELVVEMEAIVQRVAELACIGGVTSGKYTISNSVYTASRRVYAYKLLQVLRISTQQS
ncbi:hypothetical protein Pcac1_g28362 [Phytophthora cactorum]|nr:hypothetical protein Pcac1_g28362 [Phytophthora cactorum]